LDTKEGRLQGFEIEAHNAGMRKFDISETMRIFIVVRHLFDHAKT
jgi:hypothetical protein